MVWNGLVTSFPEAGMRAWSDGEVLEQDVVAQHVGEVLDGDEGGVLIFR